jgi:hypothetical protein
MKHEGKLTADGTGFTDKFKIRASSPVREPTNDLVFQSRMLGVRDGAA